jgi:hypothetical protein
MLPFPFRLVTRQMFRVRKFGEVRSWRRCTLRIAAAGKDPVRRKPLGSEEGAVQLARPFEELTSEYPRGRARDGARQFQLKPVVGRYRFCNPAHETTTIGFLSDIMCIIGVSEQCGSRNIPAARSVQLPRATSPQTKEAQHG